MSKYFPWVVSLDIFFGDVFWVLGAVFWGDAFWVGMIRGGVRPGFQVLFDFTSLHFLVRLPTPT